MSIPDNLFYRPILKKKTLPFSKRPANPVEIPENILKDMIRGRWNKVCRIKIGEYVTKTNSELGDLHPNGTEGKVIGNIQHPTMGERYYVTFDPLIPTFVHGSKVIKKVK